MEVSEIKECMKDLEHASSSDRKVEILERLQRDFKPTEQLLRETKIGVAVNRLRSHADPRVAGLVKQIVGFWREQVQQQKARQLHKKSGANSSGSGTPGAASEPATGPAAAPRKRDAKSDGVDTAIYADSVRNSCVQVTYNALVIDTEVPSARVLSAAKDVEAAVYEAEKGTTPVYRNKMRSLYMNLKDPKNPSLRKQVLLGKIDGERLRNMTPQEMAHDDLKKEIEAIEKQNLFNAQGAQEKNGTTDRFTCGRCKQKKVSYYQMQTRSADEPLTTFCTCEACGHRWKFS